MSPRSIGPYTILRQLGRGGMGVVYAVSDPGQPGRTLALKLHEASALGRGVERFRREGEALGRVRHPAVVGVHAAEEVSQGHYLVTDLVEGEDLKTALTRGPLPTEQVARIGVRLGSALDALHAEGVLHRDLKPENVILQPNGEPVLIDFGLAKDLRGDDLTQTGALLGTPAYMAPEQANGDTPRLADPRVDVYGLGATLFALAAGRPPFASDDRGPLALIARVMEGKVEWPPAGTLDPDLEAILRRALRARQAQRYATPQALVADLERLLAGERVRARRWPWLVGSGALLLSALAYALVPTPKAPPPPLELTVDWPAAIAREADVELSGRVDGIQGSSARVRCGDAEARARADAGGRFRLRLTLREGANRLRVVAREGERAASSPERELVFRPAPEWFYRLAAEQRPPWPLPPGLRCSEVEREYRLEGGMVLLWIPPGEYLRGGGSNDAKNRHRARISGFFLGKHEVTFGDYWAAQKDVPREGLPGVTARMPVVNVTWGEADAFCQELGGRLPTESEWEYAARGPQAWLYPWGNEPPGERTINLDGTLDRCEGLAEVDRFSEDVSVFGVRGMAGNAVEWTSDWAFGYPPEEGQVLVDPQGPTGKVGAGKKIVRGAGVTALHPAPLNRRQHRFPDERQPGIGFRLALDPR